MDILRPRGNSGYHPVPGGKGSDIAGRTSLGGPPFGGRVHGAPGEDDINRPVYAGTQNDNQIRKDRGPWWHVEDVAPYPAKREFTKAGPVRPELHMRTFAWRQQSGDSFQSREGMHTEIPKQQPQLLSGKETMQRARQNRLTVQVYRGQSYSQTTKPQGA